MCRFSFALSLPTTRLVTLHKSIVSAHKAIVLPHHCPVPAPNTIAPQTSSNEFIPILDAIATDLSIRRGTVCHAPTLFVRAWHCRALVRIYRIHKSNWYQISSISKNPKIYVGQ